MRLARTPARPPAETIVALIDVIFFLLVFFMLVGRMDANAPFDVLPPVTEIGEPLPKGGATVSVSRDGLLALDGAPMEREAVVASLAARAEPFIRINAHGEAELRRILPLVTALEDLGQAEIVLVVTPGAP